MHIFFMHRAHLSWPAHQQVRASLIYGWASSHTGFGLMRATWPCRQPNMWGRWGLLWSNTFATMSWPALPEVLSSGQVRLLMFSSACSFFRCSQLTLSLGHYASASKSHSPPSHLKSCMDKNMAIAVSIGWNSGCWVSKGGGAAVQTLPSPGYASCTSHNWSLESWCVWISWERMQRSDQQCHINSFGETLGSNEGFQASHIWPQNV